MPVRYELPSLPSAVYGVALAARAQSQQDRLTTGLRRLVLEDPTLSIHHDDATHQTVLSGSGETHLQVAMARIRGLGVEIDTEDVRVAYRETLARPIEVEGKYKKQTGGHGQFGVAKVRFDPLPGGSGFEFASKVTGGAIPKNLIPAVGAGIEEAMSHGGRYGFPVVDVKAVCLDGKHHSVDSSEMSFRMAGSSAFRAAVEDAGVVVLEPVSEIEVDVGNEHQGDVLGDLNSRRAQVLGTEPGSAGDRTAIHALVPTSEIMKYAIDLRSMTAGTGAFNLEHHGYQVLPEAMLSRLTTGG
jgi:elongation factor G